MKYVLFFLFILISSSSFAQDYSKPINVEKNKNLEVLFTIYSQIWTPFLYDGVTESMLANTRLMEKNYTHFKAYKDHKAVSKIGEFMGRSGTDVFLYAFYYEDFPNVKRKGDIPDILFNYLNPDRLLALQEIDSIMHYAEKFYIDSDFESFYLENEYVYQLAIEEVSKNLPNQEFIPFLEGYFGDVYDSYDFFVIPFFKAEFGMAFQYENEKETRNFTFIAPFKPAEINADRIYKVGYDSEEDILEWVVHEYSHTFYYPSLSKEENMAALNEFEDLFKPIKNSPQIGDWFSMFGEHISVAFEIRAAELLGQHDRRTMLLEKHEDWHYLEHYLNQLKRYEQNRDIYPSISDFMPHLIASSEELRDS